MSWDYAFFEYYLSAALAICAMFGMGATLTVRDFWNVARAPQSVLMVLLLQVLATPCLAIVLASLLRIPQGIALGMLFVAAMPGGLFSNILTYLGRGNVALSISATGVSTLGCLVTTTFVLEVFGAAQLPEGFAMPLERIVFEIAGCLLVPLLLGMLLHRVLPGYQATAAKLCVRTSIGILLLIILAGLVSGRLQLLEFGWRSPVALVLFAVGSLWMAYGLGVVMRMSMADCLTVGIEVVVRNANLGILLKAALFPAVAGVSDPIGDGVLYSVIFYGLTSLVIGGIEAFARRKRIGLLFGRKSAYFNEPDVA